MIEQWLSTLPQLIENSLWLAPLFAVVAGILTSLTPCSLASVPLIIGYIGSSSTHDSKKALKISLVFAVGMATVYVTLGVLASLLGKFIEIPHGVVNIVLGILLILMALQIMDILNVIPTVELSDKFIKKGYTGAFLAGMLGGLFSSHCAIPALVVLLGLVLREGNVFFGILLPFLFAAAHSIPVLIAGTSTSFIKKLTASSKYTSYSKIVQYLLGGLILIIALYLLYLGIFTSHAHDEAACSFGFIAMKNYGIMR